VSEKKSGTDSGVRRVALFNLTEKKGGRINNSKDEGGGAVWRVGLYPSVTVSHRGKTQNKDAGTEKGRDEKNVQRCRGGPTGRSASRRWVGGWGGGQQPCNV